MYVRFFRKVISMLIVIYEIEAYIYTLKLFNTEHASPLVPFG